MEGSCAEPRLIETMRYAQQRVRLWPGHRARLLNSAQALGYPLDPLVLDAWFNQQLATLPAQPHRLRLLLTADGRLSLESANLASTATPVRVALTTTHLDAGEALLRHKTTYRPWFATAQDWLQSHPEFFDVIFVNAADELCEGSRCNVYIQDTQGQWLTPDHTCGLLPGVQRRALLDQGLVCEAHISRKDFEEAPAIRVSNALRGWLDAEFVPSPPTATPKWDNRTA